MKTPPRPRESVNNYRIKSSASNQIASLKKSEIVWLLTHRCEHYHNYLEHYRCFKRHDNTKILFIDIETSPNLGYSWQKYDTTIIEFVKEWTIISVGYKWQGKPAEVLTGDERKLIKKVRDLLDEADLVVAHNGDRFDLRKINTRIAYYKIDPPSKYKTYDTLKKIKKHFGLNSNKLDDVGAYFGLGRKIKHEGFELWKKCMAGDKKAISRMVRYNKQDVLLLEKLFDKLQDWH